MTTYSENQPYLYVIGWKNLDRWYIGIRYARHCHPSDLWVSYFTSSKHVKQFRLEHGEPDHIEVVLSGTREQVIQLEQNAISEWRLHQDDRWVNRAASGNLFNHTGLERSQAHCDAISAAKLAKPRTFSAHERQERSEQLKASPYHARYPFEGEMLTMREVSRRTGVNYHYLRRAYAKGETIAQIVANRMTAT